MVALLIEDLVVAYGDVVAVDGVSVVADEGEILAVLGPNGAGKTTTVETAEGYRRPTSGSVRIFGRDPVADRDAVVPLMGVMLQRGGVYPTMCARDVVPLFAAFYEHPADPFELIQRVGLAEVDRTPSRRLSGGEQQRLALALALVGRPRIAFLDEPSAGMDPQGRHVLWEAIRDLRRDGVAVVLTTHNLEEAERLADRVVILDRGKVVAAGTPASLMRSGAGKEIRFGGPAGLDVTGLAVHLAATVVEDRPGEYRVDTEASPVNVARLTAWLAEADVPVGDIRAGRQTLEDVFLRMTGQASAAESDRKPRRERGSHRRSRPSKVGADDG